MLPFASPFDERLWAEGPPALFTLDPRGELRVDPERTREILLLCPDLDSWSGGTSPVPRRPHAPRTESDTTWVLTDTVTGLRMVIVATHPALAALQPRATAEAASSFEAALAQVRGQWAPRAAPVSALGADPDEG